MSWEPQEPIRERLRKEAGSIDKVAGFTCALVYPSPYHAGMSSLGFQQIYRLIQGADGLSCVRAFLPDDAARRDAPLAYESMRPLTHYPVLAFSVAFELEIAGLVLMLERSGLPALREERTEAHPFVLAGGPLTFSNPLPLAAFADAIVMGEADEIVVPVLRTIREAGTKAAALAALADVPHVFVPSLHGDAMPPIAKCDTALLPAWSPIRTPDTELSDMFLVEAERGCSRACTYCVMRRSTNGGMRLVPKETILGLVPAAARRVGLVGAAVSDHPKIASIVRELAESGRHVGLSSLRPDRLGEELVGALAAAGHRTLTTAMDGPSERLRESLERRARVKHLERAAQLARAHGMKRLKLYLMIGLPTETEADIDECAAFVTELSAVVPVALGIAPFCAKRNTPLDGQPFAGVDVVTSRLDRLRRGLRGRAEVRSTSAKWAWVEYVLAQGGVAEARAARDAALAGGTYASYKAAFSAAAARSPSPRRLAIAPL